MTFSVVQPVVKGWCPGLHMPMQAADGWLVRVRPLFGRVSAQRALLLADEAERHGNGVITLTNRGSLQLRGFTYEQALLFSRRMVEAGLGLPDPGAEKRRALQVSPLAGLDKDCAVQTLSVAYNLSEQLMSSENLSALPDKFGFVVDGGGLCPAGALKGDISLQAVAGSDTLWQVACGVARSEALDASGVVSLALDLARRFVEQADKTRPLRQPETGCLLFEACNQPYERVIIPPQKNPLLTGSLVPGVYGLGVALGSLTPEILRDCAAVASQGDGYIRLTPWHSLILAGQNAMPQITGLLTEHDDARLRVYACSGAKGCAQAAHDTPAQALALSAFLPSGASLHVSGCRKGCAHPAPADVTVVATAGEYHLARNSRAGDAPVCRVTDFEAVCAFVRSDMGEGGV